MMRLADHANPLLIRHLRQELRNKTFLLVFNLLLIAAAGLSMLFAAVAERGSANGGMLFGVLCICLTFALWVAQPLGAYQGMVREREESTWDLIELTGMRPRRILIGMLSAGLVQGVLYLSAIAPFMLMAYLLKGVDLLSIVLGLVGIVAVGITLTANAIFLASLPANKAGRATLGAVVTMNLLGIWFLGMGFWMANGHFGLIADAMASWRSDPEVFWATCLLIVNAWAWSLILPFVLSASLLTFKADNRSTGPRLAWMALLVNAAGYCAWAIRWELVHGGSRNVAEIIAVFVLCSVLWILVFGAFAVTEEYDLSPRQARWISGGPRWRRAVAWFLGPGAARGRLAFLLLIVLVAPAAIPVVRYQPTSSDSISHPTPQELLRLSGLILSYGVLILVAVDALSRRLPRLFSSPGLRRSAILPVVILLSIFCGLPAMMFPRELEWLHILNPGFGPFYLSDARLGTYRPGWAIEAGSIGIPMAGFLALLLLFYQALTRLKPGISRVVADGPASPDREA